jgi:hypothetical protein
MTKTYRLLPLIACPGMMNFLLFSVIALLMGGDGMTHAVEATPAITP